MTRVISPPKLSVPEGIPIEQLVVGMPVDEAAALLPRVFNLCRMAQGIAARAAFGLALDPKYQEALRLEILREHVVKLCLKWPRLLGIAPLNLPAGWIDDPEQLRDLLFDGLTLQEAIKTNRGVAHVLQAIDASFESREGTVGALPFTTPGTVFEAHAQENSVAARRADCQLLKDIEGQRGRAPYWRAVAVARDAETLLNGDLPPLYIQPGLAIVPAARGYYGVRSTVKDGRVHSFERMTPTDHQLVADGALRQAITNVRSENAALLISIFDPCVPLRVHHAQQGGLCDA